MSHVVIKCHKIPLINRTNFLCIKKCFSLSSPPPPPPPPHPKGTCTIGRNLWPSPISSLSPSPLSVTRRYGRRRRRNREGKGKPRRGLELLCTLPLAIRASRSWRSCRSVWRDGQRSSPRIWKACGGDIVYDFMVNCFEKNKWSGIDTSTIQRA